MQKKKKKIAFNTEGCRRKRHSADHLSATLTRIPLMQPYTHLLNFNVQRRCACMIKGVNFLARFAHKCMRRTSNTGCRQKQRSFRNKIWPQIAENGNVYRAALHYQVPSFHLICFLQDAAWSNLSIIHGLLCKPTFIMATKVYFVQITIYYGMTFCPPQVYTQITVSLSAL